MTGAVGPAGAAGVPAPSPSGLADQLAGLAALARRHGASWVVLRDPASLTWLLGGRVHVPQTLDSACLDVVVEVSPEDGAAPRLTVVTNAIEAPRLRDSELAGLVPHWVVLPWWASRDDSLPTGAGVAADRGLPGATLLGPEIAALRRTLTGEQVGRLTEVCRDAAAAATAATSRVTPGATEYAVAALLAGELLERALDPVVLLVAGQERMAAHRHPLPTTAAVGGRAMLVCCARRHGLIASVTRIVSTVPLRGEEAQTYARLLAVEAAFLDATRSGATLGSAFASGVAAYAANGFDPLEWHRHHQGGFSGWAPREFTAHHDSGQVMQESSVVAWNPSGAGWKIEDTAVVTAAGPQLLVDDGVWPRLEVAGRLRPDVLVLA